MDKSSITVYEINSKFSLRVRNSGMLQLDGSSSGSLMRTEVKMLGGAAVV